MVTISALSPDYGYVGDEFDVIGENLAGAVDFVKVNIGENVAKVLSCTDERITVRIPEDATTGKISVKFFDEELKTDLMLRVLGKPSVETISKEWGFVGDLITFTGTELGTKAEDIKMIFGDAKVNAPVTEWSETSFIAQRPIVATSGKISLMVYTQKVNTPVNEFTIRQDVYKRQVLWNGNCCWLGRRYVYVYKMNCLGSVEYRIEKILTLII